MFAATVLAASVLVSIDVQPVSGQLPKLSGVTLPGAPAVPELKSPVQLPQVQLPPVQAPQVKLPGVQTPKVQLPPVGVPSPSTPQIRAPSAGGTADGLRSSSAPRSSGATGRSGSSRAAAGRSQSRSRSAAARRRARADAPPRTHRERRFHDAVVRLWACSYAVTGVQRTVLLLRAGLEGHSPTSAPGTARRLGLSVRRVRSIQRSGLRRLRRAGARDGCAMGGGAAPSPGTAQAILAVATAPALTRFADMPAGASAGNPARADDGQVLASRASSSDEAAGKPARRVAAISDPGDGGFPFVLLLVILGALMLTALTVLRRRAADSAQPAAAAAIPEPEPAPEPEPEPEPEHLAFQPIRTEDPTPDPAPARDLRRAAGTAAAGLISVAVGIAVRARRRR
jgi:hypothetical protein